MRHPLSNFKTRAQAAFRFSYYSDPLATADDNPSAVYDDADPWGPCFCPACNSKAPPPHQWPALQVVS